MKKEKIDLVYGALLHDIGKLLQRSGKDIKDATSLGAEWFRHFSDNEAIAQHLVYDDLKGVEANLPTDSPVYITDLAAKIASSLKAEQSLASYKEDNLGKQADVFNVFSDVYSQRFLPIKSLELDREPNYAQNAKESTSQSDYSSLLDTIEKEIENWDFGPDQIDALLNLYEAHLSYVPTSTKTQELADISLATHSRLTAAFASAIQEYMIAENDSDYQKELFHEQESFYDKEAFLLVSFDLSGIQDFIYNIATAGAAKQLKARSLYLDFMGEHIADSLLEKLELTRANLLYVGGGHAYFILANTAKTKAVLEDFEEEFNQFLLKNFQTRLYVAFGWSSFSAGGI